jgi:hypothetical protein
MRVHLSYGLRAHRRRGLNAILNAIPNSATILNGELRNPAASSDPVLLIIDGGVHQFKDIVSIESKVDKAAVIADVFLGDRKLDGVWVKSCYNYTEPINFEIAQRVITRQIILGFVGQLYYYFGRQQGEYHESYGVLSVHLWTEERKPDCLHLGFEERETDRFQTLIKSCRENADEIPSHVCV